MPPNWTLVSALACLVGSAACEPALEPCIEDWLGRLCRDAPFVTVTTGEDLEQLPVLALGERSSLWSVSENELSGEPFASVVRATALCEDRDPQFAVLVRGPPGVVFLSVADGEAKAWRGGTGEGPGEFSRLVVHVWEDEPCQVGVYETQRHRLTWIAADGTVDSVRTLPSVPRMTNHRVVGRLSSRGLVGYGFRMPYAPTPEDGGDSQMWYRLGVYEAPDRSWVELLQTPGLVQLLSSPSSPPVMNMGRAPYRPDTQVWTDSTGFWVANGHWPFLRRFDADGTPAAVVWLDLRSVPVPDEDRERFLESFIGVGSGATEQAIELGRRYSRYVTFPDSTPYFHEALPLGDNVWLRLDQELRGIGGEERWLVMGAEPPRFRLLVEFPPGVRPLAHSGGVLLTRARTPLGEEQIDAYSVRIP